MLNLCCMHLLSRPCDLQLPYELVTVDFKNQEHKSPAHKKMQPFGKVCHWGGNNCWQPAQGCHALQVHP